MRVRALIFLFVIGLAALATWVALRDAKPNPTPASSGAPESSISNQEPTHETLALGDAAAPGRASGVAAGQQSLGATSQIGFFRMLGRVIDEHGAPVAGAAVSLRAGQQRSTNLVDFTMIHAGGHTHKELTATSGDDGKFVMAARRPRTESIDLEVEPGIWMTRAIRHFGPGMESDFQRLSDGDNDVGDVVVRASGAARGRVVTQNGDVLAGARVVNEKGDEAARGAFATTDAQGCFVLGHLPAGKDVLSILVDGHFVRGLIEVSIESGATADLGDLEVPTRTALTGSVVDASGAGIAGVFVRGTLDNAGASMVATRADGSFALWFEHFGRARLEVIAPGYDPWDHDASTRYDLGTSGVRIVLECKGRMTFHVTDAHTRRPVERFGLLIDSASGLVDLSHATGRALPLEDHPGGDAVSPVPHAPAFVVVRAPGYATLEARIEEDPPHPLRQTLALAKASSLRGRIVTRGAPVAAAMLVLMPDVVDLPGPTPTAYAGPEAMARRDVQGFAARPRTGYSEADGQFTFQDLSAGTYFLQIEARGSAKTALRGLSVPPQGELDLGDVVLPTSATVRGVVTTVAGESPRGFVVTLDGRHDASRAVCDQLGAFEIQGISAGAHTLTWSRPSESTWPREDDPRELQLELAAGETKEVSIDAASSAPCRLVVHVVNGGVPMSGVVVKTRFLSGSVHSSGTVLMLGATDAAGRVEGTLDGDARFELLAETNEELALGGFGETLAATPGGIVERTFVVRAGRILIDPPPNVQRPEDGFVEIQVWRPESGTKSFRAYAPRSTLRPAVHHVWGGGAIDFGAFPPGEMTVSVSFQRIVLDDREPEGVRFENLVEPYSTNVRVTEGQETHVAAP